MTTFISYSRANSKFAIRFVSDLKNAGFDVWLDQLDIPKGSRWDDEIERALEASSTFIIVLSPESIASQNVKDEIAYAIDSSKHILPILLKPCKIPFRLRRFQFVDFTNESYDEGLAEIKRLLSNTKELATATGDEQDLQQAEIQPSFKSFTDQGTPVQKPKAVETSKPVAKKARRRWDTQVIIALIGLVGTIFAALLSSPLFEKWFTAESQPTTVATALTGINQISNTQELTVTSAVSPVIQTPNLTSTFTLTPLELPVLVQAQILTALPLPANICDKAQFISDVTVPDGTIFSPNEKFTKVWRFKNVGTCTWSTDYAFVFDSGEAMGGTELQFAAEVLPGQTADIPINLQAPTTTGSYRGYWKFRNASGKFFGTGPQGNQLTWLDIKVASSPISDTPVISNTPVPDICDHAQFISDVTVPDGTIFSPKEQFIKTWRFKNIGTCTWSTKYAFVFDNGERMAGPTAQFLTQEVLPGQTIDVSVNLQAPNTGGHHIGYWKFRNASGNFFGIGSAGDKSIWLEINVNSININHISYRFVLNMCAATWYSGAGQLSCPGTEDDAKGFVLSDNAPKFESGTVGENPGLITVPQSVTNGFIQGIYPAYTVEKGDHFLSTVGCAYSATFCYVALRLDYVIVGTSDIRNLWTFRENYNGLIYHADLDLSSLAGKNVMFILYTNAFGSPIGDRAIWGEPMIVHP